MPTIVRPSGIRVEANGIATVADGGRVDQRRALDGLVPPQTRRRAARGVTEAVAGASSEIDAIARAFAEEELTLVDRIPISASAAPESASARKRRRRRDADRSPSSADAREVSVIGLEVPLEGDEQAVVLLEEDGVFTWVTAVGDQELRPLEAPGVPPAAPAPGGARKKTAKRASRSVARNSRASAAAAASATSAPQRAALFRIELTLVTPSAPTANGARRARRSWKGLGLRAMVAAVFRFVAKPLVKGVAGWLERKNIDGPVHVRDIDPADWTPHPEQGLPAKVLKADAPRLLLLVHGTFSSTIGTFGDLAASEEGRTFLQEAIDRYDHVMGWDHRTLTQTPTQNAKDLLRYLESQSWRGAPVVDVIAFSRGGLVFRSLAEELLPTSTLRNLTVRRVVFTGCTNGGTELANPANWNRLVDRYTNLAAAASRVLARVPVLTSKMVVFEQAVRGVAGFVKALAANIADDKVVPGLAAMNPRGKYVQQINSTQQGQPTIAQTYYCAITSNFDLARAETEADPSVPPGLLLRLADGTTNKLFGEPNDLVVHVAGMTLIDPQIGAYIKERLDYGANGQVHHCAYFSQNRTALSLGQWLIDTLT